MSEYKLKLKDQGILSEIEEYMKNYSTIGKWWIVDKVLYDMCREYPYHTDEHEIQAKLCVIGRTYSAQLERRKNKKEQGEVDFYYEFLVPSVKESELDERLAELKKQAHPTAENLGDILSVHKYFMDILEPSTGHKNRSFASKYLHFHCPHMFYIYDSFSSQKLNEFFARSEYPVFSPENSCGYYARYCCQSYYLQQLIAPGEKNFPRILDSFLQYKHYSANN